MRESRQTDLIHVVWTSSRFFDRDISLDSVKLLYRCTRDGYTAADFRRHCTDAGPTITLVKVAGTNFVFGAYSAVSWPQVPAGSFFTPVSDESKSSFLFSLLNAHRRPLKFKLKHSDYAIYAHASHGPVFGGGPTHSPDIIFGVRDEATAGSSPAAPGVARHATLPFNHHVGNSINTPANYVIDESTELEAGLSLTRRSSIVHDRRLLAGKALFKVHDMEVFAVR
jgi:hypothetical protein